MHFYMIAMILCLHFFTRWNFLNKAHNLLSNPPKHSNTQSDTINDNWYSHPKFIFNHTYPCIMHLYKNKKDIKHIENNSLHCLTLQKDGAFRFRVCITIVHSVKSKNHHRGVCINDMYNVLLLLVTVK